MCCPQPHQTERACYIRSETTSVCDAQRPGGPDMSSIPPQLLKKMIAVIVSIIVFIVVLVLMNMR